MTESAATLVEQTKSNSGENDVDTGGRSRSAGASTPADERSGPSSRRAVESFAVVVLALLAIAYTLYFARAILMPIVLAMVLASLLRPIVRGARRFRLPDSLTAGVLLIGVVAACILGVVNLFQPAMEWIDDAPKHIQTASEKLRTIQQKLAVLSHATEQAEQLASGQDSDAADPPPLIESEDGSLQPQVPASVESKTPIDASGEPVPVELRQPRLVKGLSYLSSTGGILASGLVTFVLAYFFLAAGDTLVNNALRTLPRLSQKRNLVELLRRIEEGLSSYLLTVTLVNIGLGVVEGCAMALLGMPTPALWGVMAACLNFIPYVGAFAGAGVTFVVALLSFDSVAFAFVPPLVYWSITVIEGSVVTPILLGRSMSLNPIFVFIAFVLWGWMWGIGGALLAIPILAVTKLSLDQFDNTRPLGMLIGGTPAPPAGPDGSSAAGR